jgi:uncharacterized membrane protein YccC
VGDSVQKLLNDRFKLAFRRTFVSLVVSHSLVASRLDKLAVKRESDVAPAPQRQQQPLTVDWITRQAVQQALHDRRMSRMRLPRLKVFIQTSSRPDSRIRELDSVGKLC